MSRHRVRVNQDVIVVDEYKIRGIVHDSINSYRVVAEETEYTEPSVVAIAEFLLRHKEADFASVCHNYKLDNPLPFED